LEYEVNDPEVSPFPLKADFKVKFVSEKGHLLVAEAMVVLQSYWLSYEYVRDPRHALEPDRAGSALMRGAFHVLSTLLPYLEPESREHLFKLAGRYNG
jgi:hypothetical protein